VINVLNLLREKNILSVPVYDDETKRWLGLVDILDVLTIVVFMNDLKVVIDAVSHKAVDWYNFTEQELKVLQEESIQTIVNASERNPWCPVSHLKPLNSLMDMLSSDVNLHRVPIIDDNEEVIGIVTQAAVINYLYKHLDKFPDTTAIKVKDYFKPSKVISVHSNNTALDAFKLMISEKVSGVAVVDPEDKLVASLSSTDLKGSLNPNLFHDLHLPVPLYLEKSIPDLFDKKNSQQPISCTNETSIYELLHKLTSNRIHRIFVVDSENRPIGVLSLCDIISMMNLDHALDKQKGSQQSTSEVMMAKEIK